MFKRIVYNQNPLDGVVQHIKNISREEDIIEAKYANIVVPSLLNEDDIKSYDPKVLFGIENPNYQYFWSTALNEKFKYVFISFKYPIKLEGIGINNFYSDWYPAYNITASNDLINWYYSTILWVNKTFTPDKKDQIYLELKRSAPVKYINITPYINKDQNYAFYGIEFFGTILNPYQNCTNQILYLTRIHSFISTLYVLIIIHA